MILLSYALSLTSTSFAMMNFASVSKTVAVVYGVDDVVVNSLVLLFLISFVVMNFVTIVALEWSLTKTFKSVAVLTILGAWIRYFTLSASDNFYTIFIG